MIVLNSIWYAVSYDADVSCYVPQITRHALPIGVKGGVALCEGMANCFEDDEGRDVEAWSRSMARLRPSRG